MKFETLRTFIKDRYRANIGFEDATKLFSSIADKAGTQNGGRGVLNVMESSIVNSLSNWIFENEDRISGRTIIIKQLNNFLSSIDFEIK
jgi:hypothetical protein